MNDTILLKQSLPELEEQIMAALKSLREGAKIERANAPPANPGAAPAPAAPAAPAAPKN